ncbi:MAG: energy transducer TonB [Bacteroidota bacterium]
MRKISFLLLFLVSLFGTNLLSAQEFKFKKKMDRYVWKDDNGWNYDLQYDAVQTQRTVGWMVQLDGQWGFVDEDGIQQIAPAYDSVNWKPYLEAAYVQKDKLFGILKPDGTFLVPMEYERIDHYEEGEALVRKGETWGIYTLEGFSPGTGNYFFRYPDFYASIPGCAKEDRDCTNQALLGKIYREVKYPGFARKMNVEGTIIIALYIGADGALKSTEILRDIGGGCGEEGERTVQAVLHEWTPAEIDGQAVPSRFVLPIKFRLE